MYTFIRQKIINIADLTSNFVRKNLAQVVIIVGSLVVLEVIQSFPYINIIPNYQFLVIGFILFLSVVLLRVSIPNKKIIFVVLILFVVASLTTIFDIKPVSNLIGFVIYVLLAIIIIRQIANDREKLKRPDLE